MYFSSKNKLWPNIMWLLPVIIMLLVFVAFLPNELYFVTLTKYLVTFLFLLNYILVWSYGFLWLSDNWVMLSLPEKIYLSMFVLFFTALASVYIYWKIDRKINGVRLD